MRLDRKNRAIKNIIYGVINKILTIVIPFVTRTILINILGSEYLGLNSLFTSILQILNLSELGISSAIVYAMYKPIAENDKNKICALLNLYKKLYRIIGIAVLLMGLVLILFLDKFITGNIPDDINIYLLFMIYLVNTFITYVLFAYKNSLLIAFQRNDVVSNVNSVLYIIQSVLQIGLLLIFKNYYIYIMMMPIITLVNNIVIAIIVKHKYPEYIAEGEVDKETKKDIKKKVSGLFVYRICSTTRNSLSSIFISAFLGLNMVAIYNNYFLILNSLYTLLCVITNSMTSGIGNSIVLDSVDKNYNDMNKLNYIYMLISGWCSCCLLCLYQPFMELCIGKENLLPFSCVILFVIYFYSLQIGNVRAAYSDAAGLWWESRYRAVIEVISNIVLSFILGKFFGIYGIILATLISILVINFGYGSLIIFKYYFKGIKAQEYYIYHFKYAIITIIVCCITYFICSLIKTNLFLELTLKILICMLIPLMLYYIIYRRNPYLKYTKYLIKDIKDKNIHIKN